MLVIGQCNRTGIGWNLLRLLTVVETMTKTTTKLAPT